MSRTASYLGGVPMRHLARQDPATGLLVTQIKAADIGRLDEYSATLPTSPGIGRVWARRICGDRWMLGYCYDHDGEHALLAWRRIEVQP